VAGIKICVKVLNGGHHQTYGQVRSLSYLSFTLVYIACLWKELIFVVIPVCCGVP
jgi:hypothetical protein